MKNLFAYITKSSKPHKPMATMNPKKEVKTIQLKPMRYNPETNTWTLLSEVK